MVELNRQLNNKWGEGHWFRLWNMLIDYQARHLGVHALGVFLSLSRHADKYGVCYPSQKLIGEELDIHPKQVGREIKLLMRLNMIKTTKKRSKGRWAHNTYILVDKSEWRRPGNCGSHGDEIPGNSQSDNHGTHSPSKKTQKKKIQNIDSVEFQKLKEEMRQLSESKKWPKPPKNNDHPP